VQIVLLNFALSKLFILVASEEGETVGDTGWLAGKLVSVAICMQLELTSITFRFECVGNGPGSRSVAIAASTVLLGGTKGAWAVAVVMTTGQSISVGN